MKLLSLASMMIPEAIVGGVIYFAPVLLYPSFDTERPFGPEGREEAGKLGRLEPRGRAAAKVDGREGRRGREPVRPGPAAPLPEQLVHEAPGRHVPADRDGEVAVAAAAGAEGDVEVEVHGWRLGGSSPKVIVEGWPS